MKFVSYYRVSTDKQGRSGLGLEAQKEHVERFVQSRSGTITHEYTEIESGKLASRPELRRALALCKSTDATLVIAKLDRLSRSVAFIANLMDAGVKFCAVDMPEASELTIHIMAAFAQHERKAISERTKAALAAAKARGTKLGNPNIAEARKCRNSAACSRKSSFAPVIQALRDPNGDTGMTLAQVADYLNRIGTPPPSGRGRWHVNTVRREIGGAA